jgi:hypothetical protein
MRRSRASWFAYALAASMAWAQPSQAEPPARSDDQAKAAKAEGDAAMESLRYAEALTAYQHAYVLKPDPALLYNEGRALQGLGRFPEALDRITQFDQTAPADLKARVPALNALLAELRERVSTLIVSCNATGARVLVRDVVIGTTPLPRAVALNAGRATIEVAADGYFPFRKELDLPPGGSLVVDAQLGSRATTGLLVVRTSVAGADVSVDGRPLGISPVETTLTAGNHKIAATHPDWKTTETSVAIRVGERRDVNVDLKPAGIHTKWWFWTAVGAVVVGGVVVTAALLTEKQAGSGDIPPGRVSGPLSPAMLRF